jgi:hypothetical protein
VQVSGQDLDVEINLAAGDGTTVDFRAAKNAGVGFGSERTRLLDMAGRPGDTVRASGVVSLTAFDFLHAQARLVFEQAQETVKLNDGKSVAVDVLTIGATDVTAFVGIEPGTADAVGFGIEDADFMMLTLVESATAAGQVARQWSTIAGSAARAGFQGADALEISGTGIELSLNRSAYDDSLVDYTATPLTFGGFTVNLPKMDLPTASIETPPKIFLNCFS